MSSDVAFVGKLKELHPRRFFLETWQEMDEDAAAERAARGSRYDVRPLVVLCAGAVFLTLMEYFGNSETLERILKSWTSMGRNAYGEVSLETWKFGRLLGYAWWSGCRVLGYWWLPALTLWALRQRVRDYGLRVRGFLDHAWIYALCYIVVLACVIVVSFTDDFSNYYPFYKLARRSWFDFVAWEILYAAQFFSLEFFFRGYWLNACKGTLGSHAIFAMVVPYCMIHFGKPWVEAIAAIIAGIVLGTLAMKTRSIWSGFLIHVSVAVSMDTAALVQTVGLPHAWWPS